MGNHIHKAWRRKERGIREPPDLPLEILLDIFARTDPITVVRCAAASKLLRRHITADPSFHRRLRNHHAEGGFVPALLVGILFYDAWEGQAGRQFVPLTPSAKLTLSLGVGNDGGRHTFKPVASRAGLVVLSRYRIAHGVTVVELCVGSPVTGEYAFLPPATVLRTSYSHVLHTGDDEDDDTSRSFFRLLALDTANRTQTFESRAGEWGPVTEPFAHLNLPDGSVIVARCSAVVLRGVAHWLYEYKDDDSAPSSQGCGVVAIPIAGAGAATAIEIQRRCLRRRRREVKEELLLARSAEGRLALLVAESLGIAMWTMSEDSTSWARRLVVDRQRILGSVKLRCDPLGCVGTNLEWFGEASGTVAFQMNGAGILLLNLHTREISQFSQGLAIRQRLQWCPYEMDLVSVLAAMKSF